MALTQTQRNELLAKYKASGMSNAEALKKVNSLTSYPSPSGSATQSAIQKAVSSSKAPSYEQLRAQGYSDSKIRSMGVQVPVSGSRIDLWQDRTNSTQSSPTSSSNSTVSNTTQNETVNASNTNVGASVSNSSGASSTSSETKVNNSADIQAALAILNKYMNQGLLDSGTYQFFKKAIELWDPDQEIDYANILNTFEQIKRDEVDPYFQEQAMIFSDEIQRNYKYLLENKKLQDEQTKDDTAKLKENMQGDLASRGLLFSGEAVKQLGAESPFAQAGTPQAAKSAIPVQFGGIPEGEFQKQVKAASSSNELRHQKSLEDLQRQAELTLGTSGASGMIAGVTPLGGVTGSMTSQQKQAYGSALTGIYNQSLNSSGYGQNQKVFNE